MKLELLEYVHENLPAGFSPYYIYNMVVDELEVGRLILREGTDTELYYAGHIGYTVYEEYRGHHYAYQACQELRKIKSKDYYIITCNPDNVPSRKTIERLGGQYQETVIIPPHLRKSFGQEDKEKMIFIWQ